MTFEQLKAEIRSWLGVDANRMSDATCGSLINMAQADLRTLDLRFFETTATLTPQANTPNTALPTRWSRPLSMYYLSGGEKADIEYLSREEFLALYPVPTETGSEVKHYTIWGSNFYWGPTPDSNLTVYHDYMADLADLADGSPNNTNALISGNWQALLFKALAYACTFIIEDNRKSQFVSEASAQELKLQILHSRAKSSGRRPISKIPGSRF